jgi:outer membrane protein OmpA-like peptidoglycan-associated protein
MRLLFSCHSLLVCPLLLATLLAHTQQQHQDTLQQRQHTLQPHQDTLQPRRDTLLLHFPVDRSDIFAVDTDHYRPGDAAQAGRIFHDSLFNPKNIDSVLITGYTDKTGTLTHNQWLSGQRATAAGEWLRELIRGRHSLGGPLSDTFRSQLTDTFPWRITPGGIAPSPERTDSDNRRAEIVILYHPRHPEATPPHAPPPPADTAAVAQYRDSTQPTAVISLPINFIVDTPVPTDATRLILPGYVARLRQYATKRMEIDGFCNSLSPLSGPTDPLFILSVNRAKFMYNYLIDAGFDPARLTYKGMGNASPINPDPTTRAEMDANMRVEIKIF